MHKSTLLLQLIPKKFFTKAFEFPNKLLYSISDTESNLKEPVQKTSTVITLVPFLPPNSDLQFSILKHT